MSNTTDAAVTLAGANAIAGLQELLDLRNDCENSAASLAEALDNLADAAGDEAAGLATFAKLMCLAGDPDLGDHLQELAGDIAGARRALDRATRFLNALADPCRGKWANEETEEEAAA
jgi:hypothetical protein